MTEKAYRARIFHLLDDPHVSDAPYQYFEDGILVTDNGHIKACGPASQYLSTLHKDTIIQHFPNHVILPGFIDTHIHYPQVDIIASYGKQLMDWLDTYTFPAETQFSDQTKCAETARFFLDELLRNGTTTALVFGTVHESSADALFDAAKARNMRLIAGKVLMDRGAPKELLDGSDLGEAATERLIKKYHGRHRLGYAITPRFAPTSSPAQLKMAGRLKSRHKDVYVHTHMSESKAEITTVAKLFPQARDYLAVYETYGLVTEKTMLAHGVRLSANMCKRIAGAGAAVSLCPTSNLFIGSGLFNLARLRRHNVKVSLGTDVGGGTSFLQLATMKTAYEVCQLRDLSLSAFEAFYMATLGGARALGLEGYIGNFERGKEADFTVLDLKATPLISHRLRSVQSVHEMLFALMILGDDRCIAATAILGDIIHRRGGAI